MLASWTVASLALAAYCPVAWRTRFSRHTSALCGPTPDLIDFIGAKGGSSTVRVGLAGGVRGLEATQPSCVGDVILEVPLSLTLADASDSSERQLPGSPPEWSWGLPWNVQLALTVLSHRADEGSAWGPFISSWPANPPQLPKNLDDETLAEAQASGTRTDRTG